MWTSRKKWYKMLTGKSILHVEQNVGKIYNKTEIMGYKMFSFQLQYFNMD